MPYESRVIHHIQMLTHQVPCVAALGLGQVGEGPTVYVVVHIQVPQD